MIGCIIQARMNSSRLPGKVMINVDNKHPLLYYVISQLQNSKLLDKIVVATTTKKDDDEIYNYVTNTKVECFRGSELDVLGRYYQCAKKFSLSTMVRIPADKPMIDPYLMDKMITIFNSNSYEYVTNFLNFHSYKSEIVFHYCKNMV